MAEVLPKMPEIPPVVHAVGFSAWKRPIVRKFLRDRLVIFTRNTARIPAGSTVLVWGRRVLEGNDLRIIRVEDGFIRSVGLGARLTPPLSWVFDPVGIYYDAGAPSYLEKLLETAAFDDALLARAARLRERLVADGITKYNTGDSPWKRPRHEKRVILVPGQVETDASVHFGSPHTSKNRDLLARVREGNPDSYIVYKPHPDVMAGLRLGGKRIDEAKALCDEIVTDVSAAEILNAVDEVHTMTSLMGFEALLRGKKVVCYGAPFYAGWGLTVDLLPVERRTRRLTLDELVCATLLLYPRYIDRQGTRDATPEETLDTIKEWKRSAEKETPGVFRALLDLFLRLRAY